VLVFLPQIVILFFFILVLEESGYLPRAAFLLDRLMGGVGLSGRSFIPLLSSFACAIPGIMAARTIGNPRDRLVTILVAPADDLLGAPAGVCAAHWRLHSAAPRAGGFELQGLVLFALYVAGIVGALAVAWVLKRLTARGQVRALMMELPAYHLPTVRNIAHGPVAAGAHLPAACGRRDPGADGGAVGAGQLSPRRRRAPRAQPSNTAWPGRWATLWRTCSSPLASTGRSALRWCQGMAAREVLVSSLGTVYACRARPSDTAVALVPIIASTWSLATALSLLAWFVFAPQCLSTLAAVRRETGGWAMPVGDGPTCSCWPTRPRSSLTGVALAAGLG
jgi:ferrous iron transport protein B